MLDSSFNETGTTLLSINIEKRYAPHTEDSVAWELRNASLNINHSNVVFEKNFFYNKEMLHNATHWLAVSLLIEVAITTGLSLDCESFKEHLKQPILFLLPASIQFLFMPIIAYAWLKIFAIAYIPAIAVIVTTSLPGGLSAYFLAALVKGDEPLSGTTSFLFTFVSFGVLPLNLFVYTSHWMLGTSVTHDNVIAYPRIIFIFLLLSIPIGVAAFSVKSNPTMMSKVNKVLQVLLVLTMLCISLLTALVYEKDFHVFMSGKLWLFCGFFPLIGLIIGFFMPFLFQFIAITHRTIAVETMTLNGAFASGILRLLLPVDAIRIYVIFPFIYSIIQFVEALLYVVLVRYKLKQEEEKKENAFFALGGVRVNRVHRISLHAIDKIRKSITRSMSSEVSDYLPDCYRDDGDDDQDVFTTTPKRNNLMRIAITEEEESGSSVKQKSSRSTKKKKKKGRTSSLKTSSSMSKSRFEDVDISKSD